MAVVRACLDRCLRVMAVGYQGVMSTERSATVRWNGDLLGGKGTILEVTSGTVSSLGVSWPSRTEGPGGNTSPEELIAAAHASCYAMALSSGLAKQGAPPDALDVTATVTFAPGQGITSSVLTVSGTVPGMDAQAFRDAAQAAKDGCPVSQALAGNVELSVDAALVG